MRAFIIDRRVIQASKSKIWELKRGEGRGWFLLQYSDIGVCLINTQSTSSIPKKSLPPKSSSFLDLVKFLASLCRVKTVSTKQAIDTANNVVRKLEALKRWDVGNEEREVLIDLSAFVMCARAEKASGDNFIQEIKRVQSYKEALESKVEDLEEMLIEEGEHLANMTEQLRKCQLENELRWELLVEYKKRVHFLENWNMDPRHIHRSIDYNLKELRDSKMAIDSVTIDPQLHVPYVATTQDIRVKRSDPRYDEDKNDEIQKTPRIS